MSSDEELAEQRRQRRAKALLDREEAARQRLPRRQERLRLPLRAVRHHAWLTPPADMGGSMRSYQDPHWNREPQAVGIGPDGSLVALWGHRAHGGWAVTHHDKQGQVVDHVVVHGPQHPSFVQPFRDGHVLLVQARSIGGSRGGENAHVFDAEGRWVRGAHLGDAIEHVLTTAAGSIWVGYFDEAAALGRGLGGHGLVRFDEDLSPVWRYPITPPERQDLPSIDDCSTLNVDGEDAWLQVYAAEHLLSVRDGAVRDHGATGAAGVSALLRDGGRGVVIGDYELNVVTPFTMNGDGMHPGQASARLVLPDAREIGRAHITCRGADAHVIVHTGWYRVDLDDLSKG